MHDEQQRKNGSTHIRFTKPVLPPDAWKQRWKTREPSDGPYPRPTCMDLNRDCAINFMALRPEEIFISDHGEPPSVSAKMYELEESATADGCPSCIVLRAVARACGEGHYDPTSEREVWVLFQKGNMLRMGIEADTPYTGTALDFIHVEMFASVGSKCPWPTIGVDANLLSLETWPVPGGRATVVNVAPTHLECASIIKGFIAQCGKIRPYCEIGSEYNPRLEVHSRRPRRFIYIGEADTDVCLRDPPSTEPRYIALSYCWGAKVGLKLLRANRDNLAQHVPWDDLLQTHKDAIMLARELGIQYLWIDALCIVQDDAEDKAGEIVNMASIYANAYLTISATGGSDGSVGLFTPRHPTHSIACTDVDDSTFTIFARTPLDHRPFRFELGGQIIANGERLLDKSPGPSPGSRSKNVLPVFTRGWTFQERLLSPRIIHFTHTELVWECLGMTSCECGVMDQSVASDTLIARQYTAGLPRDIEVRCGKLDRGRRLADQLGFLPETGGVSMSVLGARFRSDYALISTITGRMDSSNHPSREDIESYMPRTDSNTRWRNLVSEYSERTLRFATDVLPAISGFAQVWQTRQEQPVRYLAGLWEDDLQRGVLWKTGGSEETPRPKGYLAPTWSWASIRRPVEWFSTNHTAIYHAETIEASCECVESDNGFGQVKAGFLKVRGHILRTTMRRIEFQVHKPFVDFPASKNQHDDYFDSIPEIKELDQGTEITCLWWSTDVSDARTGIGYERAIVLKSHEDPVENVFMRIGVMSFTNMDEMRHLFEKATLIII